MTNRILLCLVFGFVTFMLSTALVSAQSPVNDALSGCVLAEDVHLPPNPLTDWATSLDAPLFSAQSPAADALSGSVLAEDINLPANPLTDWATSLDVALVSAQIPASEAHIGPVLPEDINLPPNPLTNWMARHRLRFFGWADWGYTGSSTGGGLLRVEPRANRFGRSGVLNQAAFVLERTLAPQEWSWGFRAEFYMGADAALLRPVTYGFGPHTSKFGTDFRQGYLSIHAPVLTEGGIDFKLGRQYVPLGYESTMAPYRPMYSQAYVWLYSQNGATTGAIATIHVNPRLDLIGGVTLGVNSLYGLVGREPCYIVRGLYWLDPDERTKLVGTLYTGPEPIKPAEGHLGLWQTEVELQLVHEVNPRLTLVSETNLGWDAQDPGNNYHTSQWYGTYGMGIFHATRQLDVNFRAEWFDDVDGSRIGKRANYGEITLGLNIMPAFFINFRPEVRWDVASTPVFGPQGTSSPHRDQWTYAFEVLLKF